MKKWQAFTLIWLIFTVVGGIISFMTNQNAWFWGGIFVGLFFAPAPFYLMDKKKKKQ